MARASLPPSSAGWKMKCTKAVEIAMRGQVLRRAQQHAVMAVMAITVHAALDGGAMREAVSPGIGKASMSAQPDALAART